MSPTSPWTCGDCSQSEDGKRTIRGVCHHCGKLLCNECFRLIRDSAFAVSALGRSPRAVHCRRCRSRHHPASLLPVRGR